MTDRDSSNLAATAAHYAREAGPGPGPDVPSCAELAADAHADGAQERERALRVGQRLNALGLHIVALDFVAERSTAAQVIEHIEGYCWPRRDEGWRNAAALVIADLRRPDLASGGVA